jgi:hypothetical protein
LSASGAATARFFLSDATPAESFSRSATTACLFLSDATRGATWRLKSAATPAESFSTRGATWRLNQGRRSQNFS